jgi:hypothetical protein
MSSSRNLRSSVSTMEGQGIQGEDAPCGDCRLLVKEDDEGLQCNLCDLWHHRTCEDVSAETYQLMMSVGGRATNVHWYCNKCNISVARVFGAIRKLETRQTVVEEKVASLDKAVHGLGGKVKGNNEAIANLDTKLQRKCDSDQVEEIVKNAVNAADWSVNAADIGESVDKKILELRESTEREKNMVIFGIKEQTGTSSTLRKLEDRKVVEDLNQYIGAGTSGNIVNVIRIGPFDKSATEPRSRPVKVVMSDVNAKKSFIKCLNKLRDAPPDSQFSKFSVNHDMSREERETNRKLGSQAKELNEGYKGPPRDFRYAVRGPPWGRKLVKIDIIRQ